MIRIERTSWIYLRQIFIKLIWNRIFNKHICESRFVYNLIYKDYNLNVGRAPQHKVQELLRNIRDKQEVQSASSSCSPAWPMRSQRPWYRWSSSGTPLESRSPSSRSYWIFSRRIYEIVIIHVRCIYVFYELVMLKLLYLVK